MPIITCRPILDAICLRMLVLTAYTEFDNIMNLFFSYTLLLCNCIICSDDAYSFLKYVDHNVHGRYLVRRIETKIN